MLGAGDQDQVISRSGSISIAPGESFGKWGWGGGLWQVSTEGEKSSCPRRASSGQTSMRMPLSWPEAHSSAVCPPLSLQPKSVA
jgi:hypothetical protein